MAASAACASRRQPVAEGLPVDPTGCGDVFLAAMAVGLLTGRTVAQALEQATRAAARNCTLTGIDDPLPSSRGRDL